MTFFFKIDHKSYVILTYADMESEDSWNSDDSSTVYTDLVTLL